MENEKQEANRIAEKLRTPLKSTGVPETDHRFTEGGYKKPGYGVSVGAAIDGSFAFEGNQGYYADGGQEAFLGTVDTMKRFFNRHRQKGKEIRYVIKTGIGGQHTPFQGIADGFAVIDDPKTVRIAGEYELGKDFEQTMSETLQELGAGWDQVAVIPSSKSGSTDETMEIFVQIFGILLKRSLMARGFSETEAVSSKDILLSYFRDLNVPRDKTSAELFNGFSLDDLAKRLASAQARLDKEGVLILFKDVLGRMFFETTDEPSQSRLSAFMRNSGLDKALGEDAPGFGAMFENVGGRWTADLHMMTFLAYFELDAQAYWTARRGHIAKIRDGKHRANQIGNRILDEDITDIALLVPDELFWFGKSNEQNFNESLWQEGFANLVAVPESLWESQAKNYSNHPTRLVINLSARSLDAQSFKVESLGPETATGKRRESLVQMYADLFSTFYGITNTVGTRLIARALLHAGHSAEDIALNDLNNPATKILQENLFLRQPYVELGKGLVDDRFKKLQEEERASAGAITRAMRRSQELARQCQVMTNIPEIADRSNVADVAAMRDFIRRVAEYAAKAGRKWVPFIYLERPGFQDLRLQLVKLGVEWVMQGTGDQHISYQQVLAQPQKYLPMMVSFVPEAGKELPGLPAIGFAKAHLNSVSPHLLRDYFAEASYEALTQLRSAEGADAKGIFIRILDSAVEKERFREAAEQVLSTVRSVLAQ